MKSNAKNGGMEEGGAQPASPAGIHSPILMGDSAPAHLVNRPDTLKTAGHWREPDPLPFTRAQRADTTLLLGGLTVSHDRLLVASFRRLGYRIEIIPQADNDSLEMGKAFCNRGMCNPAYYTVGNLLRYLQKIQQEQGLTKPQIVERYIMLTANGCGPCRFELYVGEYRKALRESGYDGFRVILFSQDATPDGDQDLGFEVTNKLLLYGVRALVLGDILNALAYRVRPYETEPGATDRVIATARDEIAAALEQGVKPDQALRSLRRALFAIPVDYTRVKPKVSIIGEFWAQVTEGDGNYRLPAFLEEEGAEVEVQPITIWILLVRWEQRYDAGGHAGLSPTGAPIAPRRPGAWKRILHARILEGMVRWHFRHYARLAGLRGFALPNCDRMAEMVHPYFDVNQRGGEMFMEVGKTIYTFKNRKAHMVVSVKPFGCMPSSGVSDGVQALVSEHYSHSIFLSIETTGDGRVNIYSRVQMQLHKARQVAVAEAARSLEALGSGAERVRKSLAVRAGRGLSLYSAAPRFACSAANMMYEAGRPLRRLLQWAPKAIRG